MKKRDYILFFLTIVCIAITSFFIYTRPIKENSYLQIRIDDTIFGTYALDMDQTIFINDTNTCVIKNNKVFMTYANCPDKVCIHSKAIDQHGGTIICLPNHIVLEIIANDEEFDAFT